MVLSEEASVSCGGDVELEAHTVLIQGSVDSSAQATIVGDHITLSSSAHVRAARARYTAHCYYTALCLVACSH